MVTEKLMAFPRPASNDPTRGNAEMNTPSQEGMALRDWFAGQALANSKLSDNFAPTTMARRAYQVADAMLEERRK